MKIIKFFLLLTMVASMGACSLDIPNPNAATEADVLTTKDGLLALAKGVEHRFATSTLPQAILTPGITAREIAATTTFSSLEELEAGASILSGENERISRLFSRTMRTKGMAETVLSSVDGVSMEDGTKSGLIAQASLMRGMCIGILAYNWEQVPLENSKDNDAAFVDRMSALRAAISQMKSALNGITANEPSTEFNKTLGNIDLANALKLYIARFSLIVGDNEEAISMADGINAETPSFFYYDAQNVNPIFATMFEGTIQYGPRLNFGLPSSIAPDAGDMRVGFYLAGISKSGINYDVDSIVAPFFTSSSAGIPVFYPSEVNLIKAEAYANKQDFEKAEMFLNMVRQKDAATDPLGIGAGLSDTFSAGGDLQTLKNEIFKNRRIEMYLSGTALEDSRRLGRPNPSTDVDFTNERSRNFYPYPADERLNNGNTPTDPSI